MPGIQEILIVLADWQGRILLAPICVQAGGNFDRTLETFAGAENRSRRVRERGMGESWCQQLNLSSYNAEGGTQCNVISVHYTPLLCQILIINKLNTIPPCQSRKTLGAIKALSPSRKINSNVSCCKWELLGEEHCQSIVK